MNHKEKHKAFLAIRKDTRKPIYTYNKYPLYSTKGRAMGVIKQKFGKMFKPDGVNHDGKTIDEVYAVIELEEVKEHKVE